MEFQVNVVTLTEVSRHQNADRLDVAQIAGYRCVIVRDQFQTGDQAVYIPEGSIVPQQLLEDMGLWDSETGKGKLAGPTGTRLKANRLRGIVSQGLLLPVPPGFAVGDDVAEHLGITKYVPEVPSSMRGEITPVPGVVPAYDIENILSHPDLIPEGENVFYTEKIHGTLASYAYAPQLNHPELINQNVVIASKGMVGKFGFKNVPANEKNLYVRTFRERMLEIGVWDRVKEMAGDQNIVIYGEIFGAGIQDLHYGMEKTKGFRVFDIYRGSGLGGRYLDLNELQDAVASVGLEMVPVLYAGPHSAEELARHTTGQDTLSGSHVREGVVVTPVTGRESDALKLGRVKLKSVSQDYLFRKGNQTDFN